MNCGAEGKPEPVITWFKDGAPLKDSSHRMILGHGSVFFLRVSQGKRENDAGVYWCVARNRLGSARSANAFIQIACEYLFVFVFGVTCTRGRETYVGGNRREKHK